MHCFPASRIQLVLVLGVEGGGERHLTTLTVDLGAALPLFAAKGPPAAVPGVAAAAPLVPAATGAQREDD